MITSGLKNKHARYLEHKGGSEMQLRDILQYSVEHEASDVYIVPGSPVMLKVRGVMQSYSDARVLPDESERLISGSSSSHPRRAEEYRR